MTNKLQQNARNIRHKQMDIAITSDKIAKSDKLKMQIKKEVHGKNDIVAKSIEQNSKKFDNSLQIKKANLNKISTKRKFLRK